MPLRGTAQLRIGPGILLTNELKCITMYYMKTNTLTIRLDKDLDDLLTKASRQSGRNRSEIAREALRRQLRISQFEAVRRRMMPFAEARGYLTDEDVFAEVS
jgi:predicted transcriptional regulator